MGCDWYCFTSLTGKGRIIETTHGEIEDIRESYQSYPFKKSLLKGDGEGGYDGTIDLTDEPIGDDEPYICVIFDGEILKTQIECPGPYEIEEHFVSIITGEDGQILLSSSYALNF